MLFAKRTGLLIMLCTAALMGQAQETQISSAAFARLNAHIEIPTALLTNSFTLARGQYATFNFSPEFTFTGEVMSNVQVYPNLRTVIVRSSEYKNAMLQVSMQTDADQGVTYVGRILSRQSTDGFTINKSNAGNYALEKFDTSRLLQDCNAH